VAAVVSFWSFLGETTAIPNWLIGVLFLFVAVVLFLGVLIAREALFGAAPSTPSPLQYKMDTFFGMRWRWHYYDQHPSGLAMFCPFCDFQLIPFNRSAYVAIERLIPTALNHDR
jgi:hypothetical protein